MNRDRLAALGLDLPPLPTPDRIWVDPDCGLKTRTVEEARAKLEVMMTGVRELRRTPA